MVGSLTENGDSTQRPAMGMHAHDDNGLLWYLWRGRLVDK